MVVVDETSLFVSPAAPVIVKTVPGEAGNTARDYYRYELSHSISDGKLVKAAYREILPWAAGMGLFVAGSDILTSMTTFSVMSHFHYFSGIWSGNDIDRMSMDPRVLHIWRDRIDKRILQYPYALPEYTYASPSGPNGQKLYFTSMQEVRRLLGVDVANKKGITGKGVIAVLSDTGGHRTHPMTVRLAKQTAIPGIYTDMNSHGEWTASALGGKQATDHTFTRMNPGKQPVINQGIAPDCNLVEIKALGFVIGTGSNSMLLRSLDMALADKADVLNCSWGGPISTAHYTDDPFYDPMEALRESGTIVCVASGDSGPGEGTVDSPGALPNVLSVGSINAVGNDSNSMFGQAGYTSGFSSRGPGYGMIRPDTTGYGAIIDSAIGPVLDGSYTHIVHRYQAIAGTSMSSPIVAGLMALMKQVYKRNNTPLDLDEVKRMLSKMGHSKNNDDGWGMVTFPMIQEWVHDQYNVSL